MKTTEGSDEIPEKIQSKIEEIASRFTEKHQDTIGFALREAYFTPGKELVTRSADGMVEYIVKWQKNSDFAHGYREGDPLVWLVTVQQVSEWHRDVFDPRDL